MLRPVPTDTYARRRLILAASAVVLLAVAIGAYAVITRSGNADLTRPGTSGEMAATVGAEPATPEATTTPLPTTSDPEEFALLVAAALFDWDTGTAATTSDLTERLIAVADPTGESSAGLAADIANYLPTSEAWRQLREYSTRQWIETQQVEVPSLWPQAVEQAGPDGFLPGTTAYTVTGVRHRSGVWEDDPVSTAHVVAFTVFVVCGPTYPECHLLRLSRLDEPLD